MARCMHCDGRGTIACCGDSFVTNHRDADCPTCGGNGYQTCHHCDGTGIYPKPRR